MLVIIDNDDDNIDTCLNASKVRNFLSSIWYFVCMKSNNGIFVTMTIEMTTMMVPNRAFKTGDFVY